jgi:hypothetical protein
MDQNKSYVDNLNNAKCDSRYFRNKEMGYWKLKLINFNQTVITSNFDMGIRDFKKGYQPRTKIVKHAKSDLIAEPQSILVA